MYECKNCGGELRYDIAGRKLVCRHCDERFSVDSFDKDLTAKDAPYLEANVFRCPNCGGEIVSANVSAAQYCTYCGSFAVLEKQDGSLKRPDAVIPFRISKESCIFKYQEAAKKAHFLPAKMKDPAFLENFRGIYMPYYLYDAEIDTKISMKGKSSRRKGNILHETDYWLACHAEVLCEGVPFDASSSFRDSVSADISPFRLRDLKPFSPGYLLGFYADRPDTKIETYAGDAKDAASDLIRTERIRGVPRDHRT